MTDSQGRLAGVVLLIISAVLIVGGICARETYPVVSVSCLLSLVLVGPFGLMLTFG